MIFLPESFMIQISFPSAFGCQASLLILANMMTENNWKIIDEISGLWSCCGWFVVVGRSHGGHGRIPTCCSTAREADKVKSETYQSPNSKNHAGFSQVSQGVDTAGASLATPKSPRLHDSQLSSTKWCLSSGW